MNEIHTNARTSCHINPLFGLEIDLRLQVLFCSFYSCFGPYLFVIHCLRCCSKLFLFVPIFVLCRLASIEFILHNNFIH